MGVWYFKICSRDLKRVKDLKTRNSSQLKVRSHFHKGMNFTFLFMVFHFASSRPSLSSVITVKLLQFNSSEAIRRALISLLFIWPSRSIDTWISSSKKFDGYQGFIYFPYVFASFKG